MLRLVVGTAFVSTLLSLWSIPVVTEGSEGTIEQARAKLEAGQIAQALALAERAVRQSPRDPQAHLTFGSVLLRQGRHGEAEKSFEFALALDPAVGSELGPIYLSAARHLAMGPDPDRAEILLARAIELDPQGASSGAEMLVRDALARFQAGEPDSRALLARWVARFPKHTPSGEADLFHLASFHEAEGRLGEAGKLYARCAAEYPDGELGSRASQLLTTRRVRLERLQSTSCEGRLFVSLDALEYGFATIRASITLVWASEDRYQKPSRRFRWLPETRLETGTGSALTAVSALGPAPVLDREIELRSDREHRITIEFPAAPQNQELARLVLENDSCGTTGNWRRRALHFADLAEAGSGVKTAGGMQDGAIEIPVHHIHNYIIPGSSCSGTLRLTSESISYLSGSHGFQLPCSDLLGFYQSLPASDQPFPHFGDARDGPLLIVRGTATTKRGKDKTKLWRFQDADGSPPVLLMRKNLCR